MVDVEHRRLAALEHDDLTGIQRVVQQQRRVAHHAAQAVGVREQVVDDLVDGDRAAVEDLHQQVVLLIERPLDLLAQDVLVEQILQADADPVDLVGVGRSDPAAGRADHALAEEALGHLVERAVVLRDDVRVRADLQAARVEPARVERLELREQHLEVDHDTVADHGGHTRRQDAGGQQVQRVLLVADHDSVAGVVAAVELDDDIGALTEQVCGLALALIAPLDSDDHDGGHIHSSGRIRRYTPSYPGPVDSLADRDRAEPIPRVRAPIG